LASELADRVKEAVKAERSTYSLADEPADADIDAYLEFLRDVDGAVIGGIQGRRTPFGGIGVGHAPVDDLIETARDTLKTEGRGGSTEADAYDIFRANVRDFLYEEIDKYPERRRNIVETAVGEKIDQIRYNTSSTEAQARLLRKLQRLVDGEQVEMAVTLSDGQRVDPDLEMTNLYKLCRDLPDSRRRAPDIEGEIDELSAQLAEECRDTVFEELDAYVTSEEVVSPEIGLESLRDYATGETESPPANRLEPVVTAMDRIAALHEEGLIRSEDYEAVGEEILEEIRVRHVAHADQSRASILGSLFDSVFSNT
jgi:hypothetical protein